MRFAQPEASWLLLVPVAAAALLIWDARRRRALLESLLDRRLVATMVVGAAPGRRRLKGALLVLALAAIAVALMRPQWGTKEVALVRRGIDLVFAIDTSKSMLAEDVAPNRIERVKQDVRWFLRDVVDEDRVGLVAFAGTARTLCPLTLDRGAFEIFLDELDVGAVSRGGTDLEAALRSALAAFGDESPNHKAVILFSDGEGHGGSCDRIVEEARKRGVRIYTIGIGSADGVRIPIVGPDGQRSYLRDGEGNIVLTRLDDRQLKTIAQRSLDGAYTHLSAGRDNLARIYVDNIQKIEERELQSRSEARHVERYGWFLGAALVLLALELLLPEGRRRRATT
ncbi:MAG: VWA domain-containing protein [Planctomycetota bacterium]